MITIQTNSAKTVRHNNLPAPVQQRKSSSALKRKPHPHHPLSDSLSDSLEGLQISTSDTSSKAPSTKEEEEPPKPAAAEDDQMFCLIAPPTYF